MNKTLQRVRLVKDTQEITRDIAQLTRGRFFVCEFVTKRNKLRRMVCRLGVRRHVNGTGMTYKPAEHALMTVWEPASKGYRTVNLTTIRSLRCGDYHWEAPDEGR